MRLFFALWPDDAVRAALAAVAASVAARATGATVPAAKLHVTLSFLGEVPDSRLPAAMDAAATVRGRPFELTVDTVGSFRAARVAWAGFSSAPPELASLQSRLEVSLRQREFVLEDRPYSAHATLARRIERSVPREAMPPIRWKVRDFVLVRSEAGRGNYNVMERWKLG